MKIVYSPKFAREYRKLPQQIKTLAEQKEKLFRKNPFDPKLKTHKLSGRLRDFWSFSIDYQHRIVFELASSELIYFHAVGTHEVYK
ncbi:MAG: hypothetical protein A3B10_02755 [Candidatus Doudnabacteria bacterium RIFCSPLOWO2_01_FULL_44_21]|uniref:Toxin YoeB n=1 Tax=Candidatus Doudnabacteria bacterium RIFCSPLOWO2_01_FULL_44_21 TaxID=1817841 RepID=A0A1F5Q261_9BACT|nr:MAG: hypothetical protein A3B95_03025 [Candidatus Doudnabacteria bacterium RIFCSPHIGHO2_02_FULL_43_13b]OGE96207.1 MAG: hypothetical protein A3B10_02755 [Candidatus Doudnabacteria bacterium RIFCSPLOWO2_01_FULL_44_21]